MDAPSGWWQGNRKAVPVLAVMAVLITLNLGPTSSTAIRAVEAALIVWCIGFAGWFSRRPSAAVAGTAEVAFAGVPGLDQAAEAGAVAVATPVVSARPTDADPLGQACRRFGLPVERVAPTVEVTEHQPS